MIFVVDAGNSRVKWGTYRDGHVVDAGGAAHGASRAAALDALADALPRAAGRVVVANVGGAALGAELESALTARGARDITFAATRRVACGVRCAYAEPSRLGVDRWAALVGAHASGARACVVVDAGTTVTIDALAADGVHVGGLIVAGPELATEALSQRTARIARYDVRDTRRPDAGALFGRDTGTAVAHGALLAAAATVDRAVSAAAGLLGPAPHVILTGGMAGTLADWLEARAELRPELVLEGLGRLAAAAEEA